MKAKLENVYKGWFSSIFGSILMVYAAYGWHEDWLSDAQAGGAMVAGFVMLFLRHRLEQVMSEGLGRIFDAVMDKLFGKGKGNPPTTIILLLILFSAASMTYAQKGAQNATVYRFVNVTDSTTVLPINGSIYYNQQHVPPKFRVYENGAWKDLIRTGGSVALGSAYEIPFMNAGATALSYSANLFQWDEARKTLIGGNDINFTGTSLTPAGGGHSIVIGQDIDISADYSWSAIFGDVYINSGIFNNGLMAGTGHSITGGPVGSSTVLGSTNSTAGAGLKIHNFLGGISNSFSSTGTSQSNFIWGASNTISTNEVLETALIGSRASITNVESNYNFLAGDGTTLSGVSGDLVQWATIFGEASSITINEPTRLVNNPFIIGGYLNAINLNAGAGNIFSPFILGTRNTITNAAAASLTAPMIMGYRSTTEGDMSMVTGFRGHATTGGIGSFVHGFSTTYSGSGNWTGTVEPVTAGGRHAINMSANSESQTIGHGAYADYSAIIGGQDHDIPSTSPRSVILGGNAIKARASAADQVYVPNLNVVSKAGINLSPFDAPSAPLHANILNDGVTNAVSYPLIVDHENGTYSNGFGTGIMFHLSPLDVDGAAIAAVFESTSVGAEDVSLKLQTSDNGAAPSDGLVITSDKRVYGTALHNNAGAVTGTTNQYIASGTYTPTLTGTDNVTSLTAYACQWMRVGNVVTVSGKADVTFPGVGAFEFAISLPIATALSAEGQCAGAANPREIEADMDPGVILGDVANDRALLMSWTKTISGKTMVWNFTYTIL